MRTIFAEYNPGRNSIDVYTSADYMLRIDCWEAEKNLRTTPESDCALNTLDIIVMFKKTLRIISSQRFRQLFSFL